jgi:hypothetical protein
MVCQRSPSGCRSGFEVWNGSSNASMAVSNDNPCLTRFAAALSGSQVQRTTAPLCSYKYGATITWCQGRRSRNGAKSGRCPRPIQLSSQSRRADWSRLRLQSALRSAALLGRRMRCQQLRGRARRTARCMTGGLYIGGGTCSESANWHVPDGQIRSVTRLRFFICPAPLAKIFLFYRSQISSIFSVVPSHKGAARDRHETRGGMRWTRTVLLTRAFDADGEGVWSWHPDAGVKFAKGNFCGRRWPKSPCTGESAR